MGDWDWLNSEGLRLLFYYITRIDLRVNVDPRLHMKALVIMRVVRDRISRESF